MACHLVTSHLVKVVRLHGATPDKAGSEWSVDCEFEDLAHPGSEEVSLQQTSIAVALEDVADCDARAGVPNMSGEFTPGRAAAGIVTAVGPLVTALKIGDRVVYTSGLPSGAFCAARIVPVRHLSLVPTGVPMEVAAHALLEGIPALDLLKAGGRVGEGQWVLVADAVRGRGLILSQLAARECRVIVSVGSEAEARVAEGCGCRHVALHCGAGLEDSVESITRGEGVAAVLFPREGGSTEEALFRGCVAGGARWLLYGGPPHVGGEGKEEGSEGKTIDYSESHAREILQLLKEGVFKYPIGKSYTLEQAREALEAVRNRVHVEGVILIPSPPTPQELATCT